MEIKQGNIVEVNYTGKFTDDKVFDSSEGKAPLKFTVGSKQVIQGFEEAVVGMKIGEKVNVLINPENGYGEMSDKLIQEVPLKNIPEGVQVGQALQANNDGQPINVIIDEIKDDIVVVNANHPLAGKTLVFDIEIVSIA